MIQGLFQVKNSKAIDLPQLIVSEGNVLLQMLCLEHTGKYYDLG
jgi:hypothetical protein